MVLYAKEEYIMLSKKVIIEQPHISKYKDYVQADMITKCRRPSMAVYRLFHNQMIQNTFEFDSWYETIYEQCLKGCLSSGMVLNYQMLYHYSIKKLKHGFYHICVRIAC